MSRGYSISIQDWMDDIDLTDKQRILYATIFGHSQDGCSRMRATAKYISKRCHCSERHAQRLIRDLECKGLIRHEVVTTEAGCITEFWAVLPEDAVKPDKGSKEKIPWRGLRHRCRKGGYDMNVVMGNDMRVAGGHDIGVATPITVSRYTNISSRRSSKENAHTRVKNNDDNDDVFNLFDKESGLAPGTPLRMPFQEDVFTKAWKRLMEMPGWAAKCPVTLQMILDDLGEKCDLSEAVFCVNMAVRKEWTDLTPGEILARENPDNIPHYQTNQERLDVLESAKELNDVQRAELDVLRNKICVRAEK